MEITVINRSYKDKPPMELSVMRCEPEVWEMFAKHHYMSETLNKSCKCLVFFLNGEICAFVGVINPPRRGTPLAHAISRIVVLPDYQGLGLSGKILDFIGGLLKSKGEEYLLYIKTVHDKMGKWLERSANWQPTSYNGKKRSNTSYEEGKYNNRLDRSSYCYRYDGPPLQDDIDKYLDLLLPVGDLRERKNAEEIFMVKDKQIEIKQLSLWNF
jgi:GNAT superfamily N-acetyltransferase